MTDEEKKQAQAYLAAKDKGFARIASLRKDSIGKLTDQAAVDAFNQIAAQVPPSNSSRPITGLITQQAWFSRLHGS